MNNKKDADGNLLPDEQRLTAYGKWLRATSLDELPELINIAKGDMAIIGPRPLLVKYLPYYRDEERARHAVRPGLTGLAQVNGRNNLLWDDRLHMDVEYVNHLTFGEDLSILFKTVYKVIKRADVAEKRITPLDEARQQEGK
jgi:lipopolysaccharide/colanic/teichoic acid biosynthesis glycosyltransferase